MVGDQSAFFAVWPSEYIDPLNSSDAIKEIANATAMEYEDDLRQHLTSNARGSKHIGLDVAWPFVIRSVTSRSSAAFVLDTYLRTTTLANNFGGGAVPQEAGRQQVVLDMLLQTPRGFARSHKLDWPQQHHIELFPAWPLTLPASFRNLRAKGGFLVSADWNNRTQLIENILVEATVAGPCTVRLPGTDAVSALCAGEHRLVKQGGEFFTLQMSAGESCELHQQATLV